MKRSYDETILQRISDQWPKFVPPHLVDGYLASGHHAMFVDDEDVGIATMEYPGVYTVHWFFESRGREAIKQARAMVDELFQTTDAKLLRGLTEVSLKGARWAARQFGMTSQGIFTFPDGEYELFTITKDEFYGLCR
jgi:hypothetical protein